MRLHRLLIMSGLSASFSAVSSFAADIIVTRTLIHTGEVVGVEADGVLLKLPGLGQIKVYKADIQQLQLDKPARYDAALADLQKGAYQSAAEGLKFVADKYGGLNVPWVKEAMLRLGDAYAGLGDFAKARAAFDDFAQRYPDAVQDAGLDVKFARVLVEQKDYAKAAPILTKFLEPLLKQEYLADEKQRAVAEALVLLGDCQRATNLSDKALDNYLLVVTLFDVDAARTAEARYKAAQTFESLSNWKRAKDSYEDLLRESPGVSFAADAQKRLASLKADHPE